jgi:aminoglycoside phosphotransferase (APT) family kinase protein
VTADKLNIQAKLVTMLMRLPSAKSYEPQVQKEQTWLPILAKAVSIQIPAPIAMGVPSSLYPWH